MLWRKKMEIKKYEVEIKGTTPLIWNVMSLELQEEQKVLKKDELCEWSRNRVNWIRKAEFDAEGNVIIPQRWFKSALINSCKKNRIVPHYATKKNETYTYYVQSLMVFSEGFVCKEKDLEEFGEFVGAQGKNSATKIWRVRPMKKEWSAKFIILDSAGRINLGELKEIIEFAGLMVGLGDNRSNNYGRFELNKLLVKK